jgi:uncharacterized protein (TIGR03435 family)
VWWIGARLVAEREQACDEEVLRLGNQPDVYADAILNVCKLYVESPLRCVSGVSGASIRGRIEAIMSTRRLQGLNGTKKLLLATAGFAALAGPIAIGLLIGAGNASSIHAQPAARPKFDVVSVRRCMPGDELNGAPGGRGGRGGRGPRFSPGRLRMQCLPISNMIGFAYLDAEPLLNRTRMPADSSWLNGTGPGWIYSDWYIVDAETDNPVANGSTADPRGEAMNVMRQMLQVALEDRFQLKIHREAEEVPMYDLTVAKGGLKVKPMEPGGCIEFDPSKGVKPAEMFPPGKKPMCITGIHMNGPDWAIDTAGQNLANLARALSGPLNRHVFDKTGLNDLFIIQLQFAHDESTPGNFPAAIRDQLFPPADVPPGPSIFTVLEGLGLKLEPTRGPQGYVVLDHIERPSEN